MADQAGAYRLIPVSVACDWEYFFFSPNGILVNRKVTPSPFVSTLFYTWVQRDTES